MVKNTEWRNWEKGELRQMNTNIITQKKHKTENKMYLKSLILDHHEWLQFHHLHIKYTANRNSGGVPSKSVIQNFFL